jgi:hypothetical protein
LASVGTCSVAASASCRSECRQADETLQCGERRQIESGQAEARRQHVAQHPRRDEQQYQAEEHRPADDIGQSLQQTLRARSALFLALVVLADGLDILIDRSGHRIGGRWIRIHGPDEMRYSSVTCRSLSRCQNH